MPPAPEGCLLLSVAARVPPFELSGETVAKAYGRPPTKGARRSSAYDEDALTLAADAASRCLEGFERSRVRALYVASTTWPIAAAPQAQRIAAALDLPDSVEVSTLGGAWGCGMAALRLAACAPRWPALVIAADRLTEEPGSERETAVGDGAAAVLIGEGNGIARIASWASHAEVTAWASEDARFLTVQASRLASLVRTEGCARAAVSAPGLRNARAAASVARIPSCDGGMERIGFCGAAHPLLSLIEALESSRPGDRIAWVACAEGVESAVVEAVAPARTRSFAEGLENARPVSAYGQWLATRTFFDREDVRAVFSSPALEARDAEFLLRLRGARCEACGAVHTIPSPACARCGATGGFARLPLSRRGRIFTFTHEHYVPTPTPPVTMAVIDLDGGGRIVAQVADAPPEEVRTGRRVRLVLRRLHMGGGVPNYYWKAVLE